MSNTSSNPFSIIVRDGLQLNGKEWLLDPVKGAIVLVHGLGEHIGRYEHVAQHFNKIGLSVFGFDLRGHGLSEGKRGHTHSHERMLDDIEEILMYVRAEYNELPIFVFGHSMGGNLVANYIIKKSVNELTAAVISSPWLKTVQEISESKIKTVRFVNKIFPSLTQSNGLNTDFLTSDTVINKAYADDPLVHDKISVRMFLDFHDAGEWAITNANQVKLKSFVYHGTDDNITLPQATEEFASSARDQVTFKLYSETKHEPHNDLKQEIVLREVCEWIQSQLKTTGITSK